MLVEFRPVLLVVQEIICLVMLSTALMVVHGYLIGSLWVTDEWVLSIVDSV